MLSLLRRGSARHFATSFHWLEERPLPEHRERFYETRYQRGAYTLTLTKDSYFAWETLSSGHSYDDFVLDADVEIDSSNGHSAVGVVFRHVTDDSFYSLLVSSRGNFRFDLLLNNHPVHLVEWTPLPEPEAVRRRLSVIGRGSRFTFLVDEEWVGEFDDEVLPSGGIGFAAQNFAGAGPGAFRLCRLALEARPVLVERDHLRWSSFLPVSPAARLRLAETLCSMGSYEAAAVQLRKGLRERQGTVRERFLLAECYTHLSLYQDALVELDEVQKREPEHREARIERANLLYLTNQLERAREAITAVLADPRTVPGPAHWNLLGNAEYGLGNWQQASQAYLRATELDPKMPLFLRNAARALERAGRPEAAVDAYLRAARVLFDEESFDELSTIVPRLSALAPRTAEVRALEAKMLYREGRAEQAFQILSDLDAQGSQDSSVHYLLGIMLNGKGQRELAVPHLERAAELEPSFPLYQFRLAETLHLLGRECGPALQRALALAPQDPWTCNLAGMIRMEAGDFAAATSLLRTALQGAPEEREIVVNLSEALSRSGDHSEALKVLGDLVALTADSARVANQRGNILGRLGDHARAVREYETAIRLDPRDWTLKENCAAACLQIDMVHRAEELLAQIEPEHPSASVYNLLGNVAVLKGESARAELAYVTGLGLQPANRDIALNLATVYRERGNFAAAKKLLTDVLARLPDDARIRQELDRIRAERERAISCDGCGRTWWVPRDLAAQPAIRVRGEPPGDAPAGRCPRCSKVFCVACASAHVVEQRLCCPECHEALKLSEDSLKWLLAEALEAGETAQPEGPREAPAPAAPAAAPDAPAAPAAADAATAAGDPAAPDASTGPDASGTPRAPVPPVEPPGSGGQALG